jgi:sulfide dehydrogenase [flavocytochrome c] flavoprotein chain
MNTFNRRQFLRLIGGAAAFAALPPMVHGAVPPRVVVIGGGYGGATVSKYLRLWSGGSVDVTMVDPNASHVSCILSNLVVVGAVPLSRVTISYDTLRTTYGVNVVQDRATTIDSVARRVTLASGATLDYDRLILSPGIDFVPVQGWDPSLVPHAWQAGPQTTLLMNQLAAMPAGGTFVLTVPNMPYRCPVGPYERACMVADYLVTNKPGSRVILLDANPAIVAEPHTFSTAFSTIYAGVIEYHSSVSVSSVDSTNKTIQTSIGQFAADVLNLIPDEQAGTIVRATGLAVDPTGRWAPVHPLSYASTVYGDVHVIGDSQDTGQPKTGHMASSQAKVCADAILRAFAGEAPDPAPVTNSGCFSPITATTASWVTGGFQYDPGTDTMQLVTASFGEADAPTTTNYRKMISWADNIFADSFAGTP